MGAVGSARDLAAGSRHRPASLSNRVCVRATSDVRRVRAVVLNETALEDAIRGGRLRVTYAFDPDDAQFTLIDPPAQVQPEDENAIGTRIFRTRVFADRLGLSVGPLLMSHSYGWRRDRKRHKSEWGIFDLRKTAGVVLVRPGESVTVNTVESLRLGPDICAFILPRLSLATAGLVVSTTYVDAYWDGILVVNVVNTGKRPIQLRVGEAFAQAFFLNVAGTELPPTVQTRFSQKSHHYSLGWKSVLNSDRSAIPLRKSVAPGLFRRHDWTALHILRRVGAPLAAFGVTVAALVGALLYIGELRANLNDLEQVQQTQSDFRKSLTALERQAGLVSAPITGRSVVNLPAGQLVAQSTAQLPASTSAGSLAFAVLVPAAPEVAIDGEVVGTTGAATLQLSLRAASPVPVDRTFGVVWLIK